MAGLVTGDDTWINQGAPERRSENAGSSGRPFPIPPLRPYVRGAVRKGGYGDKWASE